MYTLFVAKNLSKVEPHNSGCEGFFALKFGGFIEIGQKLFFTI